MGSHHGTAKLFQAKGYPLKLFIFFGFFKFEVNKLTILYYKKITSPHLYYFSTTLIPYIRLSTVLICWRAENMLSGNKRIATLALTALIGFGTLTFSAPSQARGNEPRFYQQQVCLAKAYIKVNNSQKSATHKAKAIKSRSKLSRSGVPESHIKELANRTLKMLQFGIQGNREARGPRLCQQWYPIG
ncbi:hypothetical protein [Kiloniella antarctica]|uniref:Uncharacterized protein n=1 Tax=Kiloniella antarctica TaxID=1550907 RepID=A0ABW5BMJ8_9PROT